MNVLPTRMSVHRECAWCPGKSEEAVRVPGTGVADGSETWWACWDSNGGHLQEQQGLLAAKSSLQPHKEIHYFFKKRGVCVKQK